MTPGAGPIRAFIALELPEEIRGALIRIQTQLRSTGADVRWCAPDALHLTLIFLGDVPEEALDGVRVGLSGACSRCPAFALAMGGTGAFPSRRRPRTVWAGCTGETEPIHALASEVATAMAQLGFAQDKPFRPHVTLGRVRSERGTRDMEAALNRLRDEAVGELAVEAAALIRSELRPQGPRYTVLSRGRLATAVGRNDCVESGDRV